MLKCAAPVSLACRTDEGNSGMFQDLPDSACVFFRAVPDCLNYSHLFLATLRIYEDPDDGSECCLERIFYCEVSPKNPKPAAAYYFNWSGRLSEEFLGEFNASTKSLKKSAMPCVK